MTECKPLLDEQFIRGWIDTDNPMWDLLRAYHTIPVASRDPRVVKAYQTYIAKCVTAYCQDYPEAQTLGPFGFEDQFRIEEIKDAPQWRRGRTLLAPRRHLVFMTYLTTVEAETGWTQFKFQKIDVNPLKGLTLIWPADWTWTYRDLPARDKYTITGYLGFTE